MSFPERSEWSPTEGSNGKVRLTERSGKQEERRVHEDNCVRSL